VKKDAQIDEHEASDDRDITHIGGWVFSQTAKDRSSGEDKGQ